MGASFKSTCATIREGCVTTGGGNGGSGAGTAGRGGNVVVQTGAALGGFVASAHAATANNPAKIPTLFHALATRS
jgi:hypothetical protein